MKKYCIQNGFVFDERGFFHENPLYFFGERIVTEEEYRASKLSEETIDAGGGYVIPGLVDIHPAAVRAAFRLFGDERVIFISDSMEATGMPDGEYELGGQKVFVKGRRALLADGTLAGSVTNLADCVRVAVKEMGIPLASAVKCAAVNPAKAIGIYGEYGSLTAGKYADLLILDRDLELKRIFRHGVNKAESR